MTNSRLLLALLPVLAACGADDDAPLAASDVSIVAPLPGQDSAVAYLTLQNESAMPLVITQVSSPEFAAVEMHTTIFGEGMAEMMRIDAITVAANSAVEFATGGKHLMLLHPLKPLAPGDEVTLEFHYEGSDQPNVLITNGTLRGNGPITSLNRPILAVKMTSLSVGPNARIQGQNWRINASRDGVFSHFFNNFSNMRRSDPR